MTDTTPTIDERLVLPLLPLSTGVVLPQMVVTLALETDEARPPPEAAGEGDRLVLLVPEARGPLLPGRDRRPGRERRRAAQRRASAWCCAACPGRPSASACRDAARACGSRPSRSLEAGDDSPRVHELVAEYRAVVNEIATRLRAGRLTEALQGVTDPGALADTAGWWPDLSVERA